MSSLTAIFPESENASATEVPGGFRRKSLPNGWPRRYVMAFLLFLLVLIKQWRETSIVYYLFNVLFIAEDASVKYPSIGNWTATELNNYYNAKLVADLLAQIPASVLIFISSSHKFLLASAVITSILHMLTPLAMNHHSAFLIVILLCQSAIASPTYIAVMELWKNWASPSERSKLVVFSLYGILIQVAASSLNVRLFSYITTDENFYITGVSGLVWALFWYNVTSETPQSDPLISEQELLYLEGNIPLDILQKTKVSDIPWKAIITSKQVLILCVIYFKLACSVDIILFGGDLSVANMEENHADLALSIPCSYLMLILVMVPCSAILADFLIKKFSGKILLIRKIFLCGGFLLQCVFMLGSLSTSVIAQAVLCIVSYIFFALSLPGFLTIPLDLSTRYVSIIAGIIFTFYMIGAICIYFLVAILVTDLMNLTATLHALFLFDGGISLICAILFGVWGDVKEEPWSFILCERSRPDGYRSYPKPEDEEDMNLVPENFEKECFKI